MSLPQDASESSGYNTSASSEFGSLEDRFKFPPTTTRASKRRAEEHVEDLDEIMKESLHLSPEKRVRLGSSRSTSSLAESADSVDNGRPPTRRSIPKNKELSPCVRSLRSPSGSSLDVFRTRDAISSDSISPKFLKQYSSPKKRISLNENGSIYSRHRLGSTFSPLVAGARRRVGTPSQSLRGLQDGSPVNSPRLSGLRKSGVIRMKLPLSDRFQRTLDD